MCGSKIKVLSEQEQEQEHEHQRSWPTLVTTSPSEHILWTKDKFLYFILLLFFFFKQKFDVHVFNPKWHTTRGRFKDIELCAILFIDGV